MCACVLVYVHAGPAWLTRKRRQAPKEKPKREEVRGVWLRNWHTYMDGICRQSRRISVYPNRGRRLCAFWNSLRTCSASSFGRHPPRSAAGRTARKQKIRREDIVSVHVTACLCGSMCVCVSEPHMWAGSMRAPIDRILGTHGRWQPRRRRRASTAGSAPPQPQHQPQHRARARAHPQPGESRKSLAGEQIKL